MAKRGNTRERNQVTEQVEQRRSGMRETAEQAEGHVSDSETERETLEQLQAGTAEGADEAAQHIEAAQDASSGEFEQLGGKLTELHGESEQFETELSTEADELGADEAKLDAAGQKLHGDAARQELAAARAAKETDREFVSTHQQQAAEARQESQRLYDEYRNRVSAAQRK
jgi:hypothetical protein